MKDGIIPFRASSDSSTRLCGSCSSACSRMRQLLCSILSHMLVATGKRLKRNVQQHHRRLQQLVSDHRDGRKTTAQLLDVLGHCVRLSSWTPLTVHAIPYAESCSTDRFAMLRCSTPAAYHPAADTNCMQCFSRLLLHSSFLDWTIVTAFCMDFLSTSLRDSGLFRTLLHDSSQDRSILLPRSSSFIGCASQSAPLSNQQSWRTD